MPKKKSKAAPQRNLSLRDRLAGHWENGKWENFITLYLRDREASDRTPWAGRLGDALYNGLTKTLFQQKDPDTALDLALLLQAEAGRVPELVTDCARVALDFLERRKNPAAGLSPLSDEAALPQPYARLRAALAALAAPRAAAKPGPTRGRPRRNPAEPSARQPGLDGVKPVRGPAAKLASRFAALGRETGLTPCSNFFKAASELEELTAGSASAPLFRGLRAVASLLRDLQRKNRDRSGLWRNLEVLGQSPEFADFKAAPPHPALLWLWGFFCDRGQAKFGRDWAAAARVMPLMMTKNFSPELTRAFKLVTSAETSRSKLLWAAAAERSAWPWPDQERYLLAAFSLHAQADPDSKAVSLPGDLAQAVAGWLGRLSEIGGRRRSGRPWPPVMADVFQTLLLYRGETLAGHLTDLVLPYADLPAPALAHLIVRAPSLREPIRRALQARRRWPLTFTPEQRSITADDLAVDVPPDPAFQILKEAAGPEDYADILEQMVETAVESSAVRLTSTRAARFSLLPWDDLWAVRATVASDLPEDGPARTFIGLVRDRRTLTEEPGGLSKLFEGLARRAARLERYAFSGNLFILLTTWPGVSGPTLVRLFDLARPFFFTTGLWPKAAGALAAVPHSDRRQSVAAGVAGLLRQSARRHPGQRPALKAFEALAAGRPLPQETAPDDSDNFDDEAFFGIMSKLFRKKGRSRRR
jgi:hypothetical protein